MCGSKVRYPVRLGALIALSNTARAGRDEQRVYRCPHCKGWHLTSQPKHGRASTTHATSPEGER